ncbi:MAG: DUF86 domain-containing protein [Nitrospira sp.]|nr:DUF86 domain-containing protein [Nitrospira sp.]
MSFEPRDYLRHILVEVECLLDQSQILTYESFVADQTLRRAFVRSLEVIGEAVKNLPAGFRAAHPEVQWRPIAQMRDRLIHSYFGVDYQLVWDVVHQKLPELKYHIQQIIDSRVEMAARHFASHVNGMRS